MKKLKKLIDILEKNDISINDYHEENILCGYELNTYTDGGVNEILFLDFRDNNLDPRNPFDFANEFLSKIDSESIDDRIDRNRLNEKYKADFTISKSLKDFKKFDKKLRKIAKKMFAYLNK
jgi:hypothetical protein